MRRFEILLERIALIGPERKKKRGLVSPYPWQSPDVAWQFNQHCQRSSQIMLSIVPLGVQLENARLDVHPITAGILD
jgi:hypothetical protein